MLRDTSTLSYKEPGIELATFWLPANPLCLLCSMLPNGKRGLGGGARGSRMSPARLVNNITELDPTLDHSSK